MTPLFIPQRVTLRYATEALGRNGPVLWAAFALFAAWGAFGFTWTIPGGPFASLPAWIRSCLDLVGEVVVVVLAVFLKNWVIRRNGHTRVRERPVWAVVVQQVQFVFPCALIVFLGIVVWMVPTMILLPVGQTPPLWGLGITVVVMAPLLLPYLFIGEVAVFGVADQTREALALSRSLMKANLPLVIGAYTLTYALPYFLPEDQAKGAALAVVTAVVSPVFLVLWTTAFGDSLLGSTDPAAQGPEPQVNR